MDNKIQIFRNEQFGSVRTVEISGEPWFVGKDVACILGYADLNKAIAMHVDDEDKLNDKSASSLGQRGGWLVNESGVYSLILRSNLPQAKQFKHWITSEVIPSIRKHGGYINGQEQMTGDELLAKAVLFANSKIEELNNRISQMRPKEIFADAVSASDTSILVRDLAKLIRQNGVDIGERRLWKWLRDNGYICVTSCYPTQKAMNMRLFEVVERTIERGDGNPIIKSTTKVTGKGQQYFINKFLGNKDSISNVEVDVNE